MMAWRKFTRTRSIEREKPFVTVGKSHFYYNAVSARLFELGNNKRVVYHIDEFERKIGFEFVNEDIDHSYSVFAKKGASGYRSGSSDLVASYQWIKSVAILPNSMERRFQLHPEHKLWVIQLCPAFEIRIERTQISQIPQEATGIYRYLNNEIIVYIGKGKIRQRINEADRENWQFNFVEYSIAPGEERQYEWESFWIERFRESNNGSLPAYNSIAGHNRNNRCEIES
jgi:hypothetical protein